MVSLSISLDEEMEESVRGRVSGGALPTLGWKAKSS